MLERERRPDAGYEMIGLLWIQAVVCARAEMPLRAIDYEVEVVGPLAQVVVHQTFVNDADHAIEAVYVFPLHERSAVDGMQIRVGDELIEGVVLEKHAAVEEYEVALDQGFTAALTTQQRPNVFTQQVGNIGPGETVEVTLRAIQPVPVLDGEYRLTIPLVVAPRFVAPDELGAVLADPWNPGSAGGPEVVEGSPLRASVLLDLHSGPHLRSFTCAMQGMQLIEEGPTRRVLEGTVALDRDFTARWTAASDRPQASAFVQDDHLLLTMEPPRSPPRSQIVPRELIWVIDQSGSMSGEPIQLVREAMLEALEHTDARDSVRILRYANVVQGDRRSRPITPKVLAESRKTIRNLQASGGTYMLDGVLEALDTRPDPTRERIVIFLTDGLIGEDRQLLAAIRDRVGDARLFAFGVGAAPNRYLLDEMSRFGGGKTTWLDADADPAEEVRRFVDTIDRPVLSDIEIDWGDWEVEQPWPRRLPALHAGQPMRITARVLRRGSSPIRVVGRLGDQPYEQEFRPLPVSSGRAIPSTWARDAIANYEQDLLWGEVPELSDQILRISLDYQVLSAYTAFLAVDRSRRIPSAEGPAEVQPVELPDQTHVVSRSAEVIYQVGGGAFGTAEEIVVSAGRDPINVESTTSAQVLSNAMMSKLPNQRTYQSIVGLSAGVTGGGGNKNISGGAPTENIYMVDGTNVSDPVTGTFTANFNYDAIEQIEVVLGGYMPEYGTSLGGMVNLVTANGTNNLEFSAAAYYTNGNWGPRMDERITADGLLLAPSGFDRQFQMLQVSSTVSGPLVRDKAWLLVSTQHDRSILANTGVPQTRDYDGHYLMTKLTVQPSATHRLTAMAQLDPTTIDNIDQGDPYIKAEAQGRQVQGGILSQGRWQWFLGPDINLETTVSTQKSYIEINGVPCTHDDDLESNPCEPGELEGEVDWETPGRIGVGGAYDSVNFLNFTFDDRWRHAASTKLAILSVRDPLGGSHDVKGGVELSHLIWNQLSGINGNVYFVDINEVPYDPTTLQNYYWVENTGPVQFRETGSQSSAFLQDSYKPRRNLTINFGSRVDRFTMRNSEGEPVLRGTLMGPRLYGAWDPTGDQRTKIATGFGRFNDTGRLAVSDQLSAARSGTHLYLGDAFGTGSGLGVLNAAAYDYDTDPAVNLTTSAPRLRTPRVDEVIVQIERELVEDVALKSHFTGRSVRNSYEYDDTNLLFDSDGSSVIGSRTSDFTQSHPRLRTPLLAKRDYFRWDLIAHKVSANRFEAQATYSLTLSSGSSPTALSGSFANDAQTRFNNGPLNTDLTHVFKSWAWWDLPTDPWTQTLGATFEYYSGAPQERLYLAENLGDGLSSQSLRIADRGTYLRLNPWWTLGLRFQQAIAVRRGRLLIDLSVTNLTNNRAPLIPDYGLLDSGNRLLTTRRQDGPTATAGLRYSF